MSRSREDVRLLADQLMFGENTFAIQDSINILGMEIDSKLSFNCHLESVARIASLNVTVLRRVKNLLNAEGLVKLYNAQARSVMEYSTPIWMSSAQEQLFLLDKVQRRADRLINDARDQTQRGQPDQGQPQRLHHKQQQQWKRPSRNLQPDAPDR